MLAAAASILACSHRTYNDVPAEIPDAGDDAPTSVPEASSGFYDVVEEPIIVEEAGGACALPKGTYTVTATPINDSGPQCPAWTATVAPPAAPNTNGPCIGGLGIGAWTSDGTLPVCAVDFLCKADDGEQTTKTAGSIEVFNGTYAGTAEAQTTPDLDGGTPPFTCTFHLDYAAK
jgi:hypothetical protein